MSNTSDPETSVLGIKVSPRKAQALEAMWKIGVLALILLNLFLKTEYVAQATYKEDKAEQVEINKQMQSAIVDIKTLIAVMDAKNEVNIRQDAQLQDHENRIRAIENGKKR